MNAFLQNLSNFLVASTGLEEDQAKFVFCLLISYPLAYLFSLLPNNPKLKVFFLF